MVCFEINDEGKKWITKNVKDSWQSIYIAGPVLFLFFGVVFAMIFGATRYLALFCSIPYGFVFWIFYKVNFYDRGRIIKSLIVSIETFPDHVKIETSEWFGQANTFCLVKYEDLKLGKKQLPGLHDNVDVFRDEKKDKNYLLSRNFIDESSQLFKELYKKTKSTPFF